MVYRGIGASVGKEPIMGAAGWAGGVAAGVGLEKRAAFSVSCERDMSKRGGINVYRITT
jgi:hypothetical protein